MSGKEEEQGDREKEETTTSEETHTFHAWSQQAKAAVVQEFSVGSSILPVHNNQLKHPDTEST